MRKFFVATLAFTLPMAAQAAQATDYNYDHNGSSMRVNVEGNQVRVYYRQPRSGLAKNGVGPGTLLFNGIVKDGYLEGKSRIFNANCGEVDYFVYGDFKPAQTFTLRGAAPVLSNMSCRIVNNTSEGPNSNLLFTALDGAQRSTPAPLASGCIIGVNTSLNVRVGPGASYAKIDELRAGTCGLKIMSRCQDGWCAIKSGNTMGWVSMRYVKR